jgi:hypothetical protein
VEVNRVNSGQDSKMFSRIAKFRKSESYEDLDRVEMDITEPTMRQYAGIRESNPEPAESAPQAEPAEGRYFIVYLFFPHA